MRLSDAIQEYVKMRAVGNAANTVKNERQALDLMLAEIGNIQTKHLDVRHGENYRSVLQSRGYKPGTFNCYKGCAARFFDWCHTRRYIPGGNSPKTGLGRNLRDNLKPRNMVEAKDFDRLLDCAEHPQERIIVALGLFLFIRASEIAYLNVESVHLDAGDIDVFQPKTGKWDTMPISEELDRELRRWMTWYAADVAGAGKGPLQPEWPLVPARRKGYLVNDGTGKCGGRPALPEYGQMNPPARLRQAYRKVQKTLVRFGWEITPEDREGVHTLRRSGARAYFEQMIAAGEVRDGILREVMSMLHHESVTMTERYLGLSADREKRNARLRGRAMFPKVVDNVVQLRPTAEAEQ